MNVEEFRKNIKIDSRIIADNREFAVEEIIKFRLDDGSFYMKCFLSDGFVLADDLGSNSFVLVREVDNNIQQPFPETLEYDGKQFNFLFDAHAVAEEVQGREIFKKGEGEKYWDYESEDGSYLSLGINDGSDERQDFYGKMIKDVEIL
ncbi:MAG: hypothetical protein US63_C0007G0005 [Candidatus Moranbacteria bacterium GW2011_GWC2_37_8]|nr:MAG: hypothetical protein US63_C0007G0005 [Candidatus Moranbacteria bacterium GW2011_GWC2_37_8]KKQ62797.1 MAG: hypothetical protein US82_C0006G0045 [Parcubacteria group bacterium GW2011_GWC1_38_22]KKQ81289.1 MAG: hypothetical protein UT03_C0007G0025 [Candidatus Moranbacteria bacterium GW2011_GWD2_38_7]